MIGIPGAEEYADDNRESIFEDFKDNVDWKERAELASKGGSKVISNHPSSNTPNCCDRGVCHGECKEAEILCGNCERLLALIKEAKDADAAYWKSLEQLGKMTMDDFFKLTEARQVAWERLIQVVK